VREQAKHVQENPRATVNSEKGRSAKPAPQARQPRAAGRASCPPAHRFKVTHGERVIDKESGVTKIELVRYYALVGELMMEHLKGRPVSLVRAPEGVGGELFFQKHVVDPRKMPGVGQLDQALDPDHPRMTRIDSVEGHPVGAQWNVVEIHSQNAVGNATTRRTASCSTSIPARASRGR
jgi:bifunctional non-homologous end joining protein LigD